jgi:release factor glutamine methyltransferase
MLVDVTKWSVRLGDKLVRHLGEAANRSEARWMMEYAFNASISSAAIEPHIMQVSTKQVRTLMTWINQRIHYRKPLQYILQDVEFTTMGLNLMVQPPILIPRPETEFMVHWIIKQYQSHNRPIRVLDIGTGSGCIALAIAAGLPSARVIGVDANQNALNLARKNLEHNTHLKLHERVQFVHWEVGSQSLPAPFDGVFDLIVSNPPYIPIHQWGSLDPEIRYWEDPQALVASDGGLSIYIDIINLVQEYGMLSQEKTGPRVVFEIGEEWQTVRLSWMMERQLGLECEVIKDQFGQVRWIAAT